MACLLAIISTIGLEISEKATTSFPTEKARGSHGTVTDFRKMLAARLKFA